MQIAIYSNTLLNYQKTMCPHFSQSCRVARMNSSHPFLRHGNIQYHRLEDIIYDSKNAQKDTDKTSEEEPKYEEKFRFILPNRGSKSNLSTSNTSSTFSEFFHDESIPEERIEQWSQDNVNTIHIVETKDDGEMHLILESRSSPTNFYKDNGTTEKEDTYKKKLPTPAKPLIEETDKKPELPEQTRMDWIEYHRLATIHSFMDNLESDYPSICTTGVIGKSLEGRDLKILRISNTDTSNACVWIDAGIHAREWIAPAVATYIANHIATNFNNLPESCTNKDWYFLPVVNPDGYEYSHTVDRMWRKNRAWHRAECVGVDLNRNFSFGWGGKGSSNAPLNAFYRGPEPFSEPESTAMRDMLVNSGLSFKVYITLHSYGQVIIFPFAFKDELCPDYVRLLEGATVMSKAIHEASGNTYKVGISRDVMYGAAGTSNDFSYGEARIPFCYLIELRSKQHRFKLPKEEIAETGNEILNCVKALMEFVDNYPVKLVS